MNQSSGRQNDDYGYLYKIALIGDMGVGKTHLLERYKNSGVQPRQMPATIGVEFATRIVKVKDLKYGEMNVRA